MPRITWASNELGSNTRVAYRSKGMPSAASCMCFWAHRDGQLYQGLLRGNLQHFEAEKLQPSNSKICAALVFFCLVLHIYMGPGVSKLISGPLRATKANGHCVMTRHHSNHCLSSMPWLLHVCCCIAIWQVACHDYCTCVAALWSDN